VYRKNICGIEATLLRRASRAAGGAGGVLRVAPLPAPIKLGATGAQPRAPLRAPEVLMHLAEYRPGSLAGTDPPSRAPDLEAPPR
jgi:hypothetical protein